MLKERFVICCGNMYCQKILPRKTRFMGNKVRNALPGARPDQDTATILAVATLGISLDSHLRKMRLRWRGHVLRMGEEAVTREALMFEKAQSWKRPLGGLRTTWRKNVAEDVEPILRPPRLRHDIWKKSWKDQCYEVAHDRLRWRAVV